MCKGVRSAVPLGLDGQNWPDSHVAVEVQLADGRKDLLIAADVENPMGVTPGWQETAMMVQEEAGLRFEGELCWVRWNADGRLSRIAVCRGQSVSIGIVTIGLKKKTDFVEIRFDDYRADVVAGPKQNVAFIKINNRSVWNR